MWTKNPPYCEPFESHLGRKLVISHLLITKHSPKKALFVLVEPQQKQVQGCQGMVHVGWLDGKIFPKAEGCFFGGCFLKMEGTFMPGLHPPKKHTNECLDVDLSLNQKIDSSVLVWSFWGQHGFERCIGATKSYSPKTNKSPENRPSQKETCLPTTIFQVLCSFISPFARYLPGWTFLSLWSLPPVEPSWTKHGGTNICSTSSVPGC